MEILKLPPDTVLDALFRRYAENKEKTASMNGELGERIQVQQQNNSGFKPPYWQIYTKIRYKALTNELSAREMIDIARAAIDAAERAIDAQGHVGDLDKQAREASRTQPQGSRPGNGGIPLDEARKGFEERSHLHVVGEKKPRGRPPKDKGGTFTEEQRAETAKGDQHIKKLLKGDPTEPELPVAR